MRSFVGLAVALVGRRAREVILDNPVDLGQERGRGEVAVLLDDAQVDPGSDRRPVRVMITTGRPFRERARAKVSRMAAMSWPSIVRTS